MSTRAPEQRRDFPRSRLQAAGQYYSYDDGSEPIRMQSDTLTFEDLVQLRWGDDDRDRASEFPSADTGQCRKW